MFKGKQKAFIAAASAAVAVLMAEFLSIPEEASRTFFGNILELIDMQSGLSAIAGSVLTFVLTYFIKNE